MLFLNLNHMRKPLSNQKGQGLIEYVILVALVGVATMGMVRLLQHSVNVNLANIVHALQSDGKRKESFEKIEADSLRKKDFGDFMNGAQNGNDK